MKNTIVIGVLLLVVGIGVYSFWGAPRTPEPAPTETASNEHGAATDFGEVGTIAFDTPGGPPGSMHLVHERSDGEPHRTALELDALSVCATQTGAVPCIAMSVTLDVLYAGKQVGVEGSMQNDGSVLVRKMQEMGDTMPAPFLTAGRVFIPWAQAVRYFESCEVAMAFQAHNLDVQLTLTDETRVVAVEPTIDEVFRVTERTREHCGPIPLATE